jgi:hypothetical protein
VGPILGDRSVQAPLPQLPMAPRPHGLPFGGTMGGDGGYGGFQPLGQFNAGMGTGMMPPAGGGAPLEPSVLGSWWDGDA